MDYSWRFIRCFYLTHARLSFFRKCDLGVDMRTVAFYPSVVWLLKENLLVGKIGLGLEKDFKVIKLVSEETV